MNGWVMPGTPSWSFGRIIPCQCTPVANGRLLVTTMRTRSPSVTRNTGPGTTPLNAYASLVTPGATSMVVGAIERWNTLMPPSSVYGASTVPSPRSFGAEPPPPVLWDTGVARPGGSGAEGSFGTSW